MDFEFSHKPVLLEQCLDGLNINPDGIYVDGTAGGAGHSKEIAKRLKNGKLYAFDQDPEAAQVAKERLEGLNAQVINANFSQMQYELSLRNVEKVDGVLLDLGVSSYQLDNPERGFSYMHDGKLDMRMSKEGFSAYDLVNEFSKEEIIKILREYGEEKFAPSIAYAIVKEREKSPIETTSRLSEIIANAVPAKARREKNPCKKSFQAIRIAVNREFESLKEGLQAGFSILGSGGRLAVITFHSLEDRIVKREFASLCQGCICPPGCPICICGNKSKAKHIVRKPIVADEKEQEENRRSKSAKLRVIEKI